MKRAILILAAICMAGFAGCKDGETKYVYLTGGSAPEPGPQPDPQQPVALERFDIYRDGGGSLNTDPQTFHFGEGGVFAEIRPFNDAGEGSEYLRFHEDNQDDGGRWRITFDRNGTGRTVNLSTFTSVSFLIRSTRPINASDQIFIRFEDGNNAVALIDIRQVLGFDVGSLTWQAVSIPTSSLTGLDRTRIRVPFGLEVGVLQGNHFDCDFDDIRWERF